MYALLILCAFLIGNTQNKINKDVTAHNETEAAAPKTKNKPLPAASGNAPNNQPNSSSNSDQHNTTPDNRVNRIEVVPQADWWFKGYVIATFFIAAANVAVLITIWRQKIVMSSQLDVMQQQVHNAAEQVIAAQGANNRISSQIRLMQTANEQTNRLIEQSITSAEAAKKSADAFVESERAWIHARLRHESGDTYYLEIANYGRTLAHIIDIRFGLSCIVPYSEPNEPYGDRTGQGINLLILPNTGFHNVRTFNEFPVIFDSDWTAIMLGTKQGIFFLAVNYKDVLGENHTSDFVYSYRIPTRRFEDMSEHRKYT